MKSCARAPEGGQVEGLPGDLMLVAVNRMKELSIRYAEDLDQVLAELGEPVVEDSMER